MQIDFSNTNTVWASILAETLKRLGLTTAVICPGSRSTPLAIAFAKQQQVEAIPVLDERSAAFFALGIAKKSGLPVVLVCTSGTAGANFYPAVIEARESRIPLLIITADRPPELRDCHSGQTIDQVKLFGTYPNWQTELAIPSVEMEMLGYLRQTTIYAWERSLFPTPGPVHLNIPFRDPLAPIPDTTADYLKLQFQEDFFAGVNELIDLQVIPNSYEVALNFLPPVVPLTKGDGGSRGSLLSASSQRISINTLVSSNLQTLIQKWQQCNKGIIIAGTVQPKFPKEYVSAVSQLSQSLGWVVLAEGLSPLRNYSQLNPHLISTYDLVLHNQQLAKQLVPEMVIQLGELPTSKQLRNWLEVKQPHRWVIDSSHHNLDPLHGKTTHLRTSVEHLAVETRNLTSLQSNYFQLWQKAEAKVRREIDITMVEMNQLFEGKAAWLISRSLPVKTPIFIANSMPVRDVEFFWTPNNSEVQPFFNRGANGIDGTLSTALGIAHHNQSSVMLTGDLALLHDTNGFLLNNKFIGHLTIVLINNNGGGIFEMLPISKFEPPFEEFFATPQNIDFARLCATYDVKHELITSWEQLKQRLNPLPNKGIRVLELPTNRKIDAKWRQQNLGKFALPNNPPEVQTPDS